jgi:hypothetical protein
MGHEAGHVALMKEKRNTYKILVGNPEGKRPPERPKCRLGDNIKMGLELIGLKGVYRSHVDLRWDKCRILVNAVMNLQVL